MAIEQLHASESVTEGHPDKLCDIVAASILDEAIIASEPFGVWPHVAMEVTAKGGPHGGTLLLAGEMKLVEGVNLDYVNIARGVIRRLGYTDPSYCFFDGMEELIVRVTEQSEDIDRGVSQKLTGAGDQGIMWGAAFAENERLMPTTLVLAHELTDAYTDAFHSQKFPWLRPDGKSQIILLYENGKPKKVLSVVMAASHSSDVNHGQVEEDIFRHIIVPVLDARGFGISRDQVIIDGAGSWTDFGPRADAGTTNRKIQVDTYGTIVQNGGGGLCGKDPTKADLFGAIGARHLAKTIVVHGLATQISINVAYAIGRPKPLMQKVHPAGTTSIAPIEQLQTIVDAADLSADGIINDLNLFQPIYARAAVGGFFGREIFPWEQINRENNGYRGTRSV
ncbi:MAG: S-adenosylmethionine synthase [Candidatus Gottesmanbacteria bacterium GW2011_GWA2_47_9]|uniref:Methionine adenosyltransferase n=1 Tax=Candidatus Gottesmanbacteria bacterium GW2011_GWA2_47_9 TaxID=1618445 RepID=A0A0G1WD11_9BACT|nr:MAG: S-adenosylmethionine synthase [Candidatus Gottesmanbacteria bacterium GW2011_GWA2_47_9]